jgi:hypothetical protein
MPGPIGITRQTAPPAISPPARLREADRQLPDRIEIERQARHLRAQAMARLFHRLCRALATALRRTAAGRTVRREAHSPSRNPQLREAP